MKRILYTIVTMLALTVSLFAQNTAIYKSQGGDAMTVGSGGTLTVASGGALVLASGSTLTDTATASHAGTQTFTGNVYFGAAGYKSTNTASSGVWAFPAAVGVGGALTGTSGSFSTTLAVTGNVQFGTPAGAYVSTFTAASGNIAAGGAISAITTITAGTGLDVTAGPLGLYSRSLAQINAITPSAAGKGIYYCNDCVDAAVCISSGTGQGAFVQISSATVHCN